MRGKEKKSQEDRLGDWEDSAIFKGARKPPKPTKPTPTKTTIIDAPKKPS